jgi:hypothetical protein
VSDIEEMPTTNHVIKSHAEWPGTEGKNFVVAAIAIKDRTDKAPEMRLLLMASKGDLGLIKGNGGIGRETITAALTGLMALMPLSMQCKVLAELTNAHNNDHSHAED